MRGNDRRKRRAENHALGLQTAICESHQRQGVFSAEGVETGEYLTPSLNSSVHSSEDV